MDAAMRIVGGLDCRLTATRQERVWLLVGGGWKSHGAMAFYLGLDHRDIEGGEGLARAIANVVAEAATLGHRLDPEEIIQALREYQLARGRVSPRSPVPG